jgi:WD40 repeat protein/ABC-type lipoprotein export system ATPase subunit
VAGSRLPAVPSVADTVRDLAEVLVDRCGLRQENLSAPLLDPADPRAFGDAVAAAAAEATDVLLLYYVGHGLISLGGELYLATSATDDLVDGLTFKALPYQAVRDAIAHSSARSTVVILDCCFAGRAQGSYGTAANDAFELASLANTYLLASTSGEVQALAPVGEKYTAFTGELLTFLRDGDPAGFPELTLDHAYWYLRRALVQRDLPAPQRQLSGAAGDLVLAPNPAAATPIVPPAPEERKSARPDEPPCPYPGLRPFTSDDARFFFGRDELIAKLLNQVTAWADGGGPIAVVGVSGVGKSSLLNAGLLPALQRGELNRRLPGARTWPVLSMRPGAHPLSVLATRLSPRAQVARETILDELRADPARATDIIRRALRLSAGRTVESGRLLIVVDQFEEVFTTCRDAAERRAFIEALCAASTGAAAPAVVVLGVRADFYAACQAYPDLAAAVNERKVTVPAMTVDQLREVIEKPARVAGLGLEPGLIDLLLRDLRAETSLPRIDPDFLNTNLPLLSYALELTWRRRGNTRTLTMAGYQATGGVWNALARQADEAYDGLDVKDRSAARMMLLRMVHVSDNFAATRRNVNLAELLAERPDEQADEQAAAISRARAAFATARLITVDGDSAQIAHEALIQAWTRLRGWIEEDRAGLLVQHQLSLAAHEWERANRDPGSLYRGKRLITARQWLDDPDRQANLSTSERQFLAASARAVRRRKASIAAVAVVTVAALAAGVVAVWQSRNAAHQEALITSRQIALRADALRDGDPAAALQLSLSAYRIAPTAEARAALIASYPKPYPTILPGHNGRIRDVVYRPDGKILASSGVDRTIRLWDVSDPYHVAPRGQLSTDGTADLAFSPDSRLLAARTPSSLVLWEVSDPAHPIKLAALDSPGPGQRDVAFSRDGRTLATTDTGGTVRLWDITDPRHPAGTGFVRADGVDVYSVAFSPSENVLATGSAATDASPDSARVRLWDVTDVRNPVPRKELPANSATSLAFSRTGTMLAAGGVIGSMRLWDVSDPANPRQQKSGLEGYDLGPRYNGDIYSVTFGSDATTFASASRNGTIELWRLDNGQIEIDKTLPGDNPVNAVAFSPDGGVLASGGDDGAVRLWTTASPSQLPGSISSNGSSSLPGSAFSPDGRLLATGWSSGDDGPTHTAQLWDVTDIHRPALVTTLPKPWVGAAFLSADRTLLTMDDARETLGLWDLSDVRHPVLESTFRHVQGLALSRDHRILAVLTGDQQPEIDLWDLTDRAHPVQANIITRIDATSTANVVPHFLDETTLLVRDGTNVRLWDVHDVRNPVAAADINDGRDLAGAAFSSYRHTLVVQDYNGPTHFWDLTDLHHPVMIEDRRFDATTQDARFVNKTTLAVITGNDRKLRLWDLNDPHHAILLSELSSDTVVAEVAVSQDEHMLAATGTGQAHIWDITDTRAPSDLGTVPLASVQHAEFGQDSHTAALTSRSPGFSTRSTGVLLMDLAPDRLYRYLCSINQQPITQDQWNRYVPDHTYQEPCG